MNGGCPHRRCCGNYCMVGNAWRQWGKRRGGDARPGRRRGRRPMARCKPRLERLEDRCLLTVTLTSQSTGLAFPDTQGFVPPDTCGAAGPVKYVETVNQTIRVS